MQHTIEEAVRVYLRLSEDGTRWVIDHSTVDGSPLFSDYDQPLHEECACLGGPFEAEGEALAERLEQDLGLPDGLELMMLLAEELGYRLERIP